ncbi:MAG: AhpC/TSA family protein [Bacteroides sp.]|nr:AhpC/TSA family protein [Bacteroides sp.]
MKRPFISSTLIFSAAVSVMAAGGFTLTGNIPGLKAGSKVELVSREPGRGGTLAETTSTDGTFVLTGEVPSPTLSELRINMPDSEGIIGKGLEIMVENVPMTVSAAHIDSVPPTFYFGSHELKREKNVTVTGGQAQKEFAEYNAAMLPFNIAARDAHYNLYHAEDRDKTEEGQKRLKTAYSEAGRAEDAARRAFIAAHPTYSISGAKLLNDLSTPFTYTTAELDALAASVSGMTDAARLAQVNKAIANSRNALRESPFTDFAALDTLGAERRLSEFADGKKYVMVDFWASWCGPCRAAIPHVRELYNKYGDKVEFIAVSLDSAEKPWRKAMEQENMEWTQLWADKTRVEAITTPYQIHGIPFMLLLDTEGRIIHAGHNPDDVTAILEKTL